MSLNIIFMGTPDFSVATLKSLVAAGHKIVACYCQPPRPAGRRGLELTKSPVHQAAEAMGIAVRTPLNFKDPEDVAEFCALKADVAIVVAYGLLLPVSILEATRLGAFNGHASLLPRWRGAAPIQRAIMAGDKTTGMMIMKMDKGLDTGPVVATEIIDITENETAGELHDRLAIVGADLMVRAMADLEADRLVAQPQSTEGVTYAAKIDKAETRIDFNRPARDVHNHIRGLAPFPGAWFEAELGGKPERIKVLSSVKAAGTAPSGTILDEQMTIACASGAVRLVTVQKAGGKPMSAVDFLRGSPIKPGTRVS